MDQHERDEREQRRKERDEGRKERDEKRTDSHHSRDERRADSHYNRDERRTDSHHSKDERRADSDYSRDERRNGSHHRDERRNESRHKRDERRYDSHHRDERRNIGHHSRDERRSAEGRVHYGDKTVESRHDRYDSNKEESGRSREVSRRERSESRSDSRRRRKKKSKKEKRSRRSPSFEPIRYPSRRKQPTMWDILPGDPRVQDLAPNLVMNDIGVSERTKHARRIYVGGIESNESELTDFILDTLYKVLGTETAERLGGSSMVVSTYLNVEKRFAFVELNSVELAHAAQALHGILFRNEPLKIRRPNDFDPSKLGPMGPIPAINLGVVGLSESNMVGLTADSPNQVFVGGLPHHLGDGQVRELLEAFGKLNSLRVARDYGETNSKGYAFCEYVNEADTSVAIEGLNGLEIGDRVLTVRRSCESAEPATHEVVVPMVPTPVLILLNMVTVGELADDEEFRDIQEDVSEECSNYGQVLSVNIPRTGEGTGKVFVEYKSAAESLNARLKLEGRSFAGRTVECQFMELEKFMRREFS